MVILGLASGAGDSVADGDWLVEPTFVTEVLELPGPAPAVIAEKILRVRMPAGRAIFL
ncbi:MAG: hypothetical protein NVSMB39_5180 [Candidatus Saccharimonadales bacterium]